MKFPIQVFLTGFFLPPGARMTWWLWTAGYTQWEVTMAAPVSTPSRSTTRAATNGSRRPACSHGAAVWAWLCWSCWTSHHPPHPPSRFPPPAFDTGSPLGWPQPLLLQPRLALGKDAIALFERGGGRETGMDKIHGWRGVKRQREGVNEAPGLVNIQHPPESMAPLLKISPPQW